ncbi:hypothetical protein [Tenebrionicola larvae]|uniref:hypothetical protein n=1 Tax=Tenebrionicola larvae TaxID=2815733 RepID=UPI002013B2CF|nr:hypothetical protein [Tenebrionicola larvae]
MSTSVIRKGLTACWRRGMREKRKCCCTTADEGEVALIAGAGGAVYAVVDYR